MEGATRLFYSSRDGAMAKNIIGIHGLANKPPKEILAGWWHTSIAEGLQKNCGLPAPEFSFRLVYWADLLHKYPLHNDHNFSFDSLYNEEPYLPARANALKEYPDSWRDDLRAGLLDLIGSGVDALKVHFGVNALADWLLSRLLKDLDFYYDDHRTLISRSGQVELARKVLRDELKMTLREEKGKDLLVVAHSMGSIIAYDALRDLGRSDPDLAVSSLVTIGSPLGLPHVKGKIIEERTYDPVVRTPSLVSRNWVNFADKKDPVAMDVHLRDDYLENQHGVRVIDDLVANDYTSPSGKENHHKSFGYLRAPEFSRLINKFLES